MNHRLIVCGLFIAAIGTSGILSVSRREPKISNTTLIREEKNVNPVSWLEEALGIKTRPPREEEVMISDELQEIVDHVTRSYLHEDVAKDPSESNLHDCSPSI